MSSAWLEPVLCNYCLYYLFPLLSVHVVQLLYGGPLPPPVAYISKSNLTSNWYEEIPSVKGFRLRYMSQREPSFFERERDRLATEVTAGFEELLSSSNVLNRKLEEVLGMTREYETIAVLWQNFHELMRVQNEPSGDPRTVPGTGTHVVSNNTGQRQ